MGLLELPNEVLSLITEHLSPKDIGNSRGSCRALFGAFERDYYRRLRNNDTFLQRTIHKGRTTTLEKLLIHGTNPDLALLDNYTRITRYNGEVIQTGEQLWTPLHRAISLGHHDMARLLLERGANVHALSRHTCECNLTAFDHDDIEEELWWMPLHTAICCNDLTMVQLLLANGASFKVATRHSGSSPRISAFHVASCRASPEICRLIFDHFRPTIDMRDPWGYSGLSLAFNFGRNWDTVEWFVQNGANINTRGWRGTSIFQAACYRGHFTKAYRLLQLGADPFVVDSYYKATPLHACCEKGLNVPNDEDSLPTSLQRIDRLTMVKLLVDKGADINARKDVTRLTPLAVAAREGFFSIVEYLVKAGAAIDAIDDEGETPLMAACRSRADHTQVVSIVKLLLKEGACVSNTNGFGCTPLDMLCITSLARSGTTTNAIARLLLAYGTHLEFYNSDSAGKVSLVYELYTRDRLRTRDENLELCNLLLEHGETSPPSQSDLRKMFNLALSRYESHALRFLLQFEEVKAMVPTMKGSWGFSQALRYNKPVIAEILLDNGCPLTYDSENDWPCLLSACRIGHLPIVQKLLQAGARASINHCSREGEIPLGLAIHQKNHSLCMLLLENGADPFGCSRPMVDAKIYIPWRCHLEDAIWQGMVEFVEAVVQKGLVTPTSPSITDIMVTICSRPCGPITDKLLEIFLRLGVDPNMMVRDPEYDYKIVRLLDMLVGRRNFEGVALLAKYDPTYPGLSSTQSGNTA